MQPYYILASIPNKVLTENLSAMLNERYTETELQIKLSECKCKKV